MNAGRELKQMSKEAALCSQNMATPFLAHSVAPLCLLTQVSKQLRRLNGLTLTYGVVWGPGRQRPCLPADPTLLSLSA